MLRDLCDEIYFSVEKLGTDRLPGYSCNYRSDLMNLSDIITNKFVQLTGELNERSVS